MISQAISQSVVHSLIWHHHFEDKPGMNAELCVGISSQQLVSWSSIHGMTHFLRIAMA
jgi:hypothetical protein